MSRNSVIVGLLEDDTEQAHLYQAWLEAAGFQVRWFPDAKDFRRKLGAESIDILLLDWVLGEGSGLEVLEWIRQSAHTKLPVIFLTARISEADVVSGLQAGADDYIPKPAKQAELVARTNAVLRRSGLAVQDNSWVKELEPYDINLDRRQISVRGERIELTDREFDLACYLFRRHGRIVSRESLLENVWNLSADVNTRTVDTHVSRLRKKLGMGGENGWVLSAVYQHGYRLEQIK